MVFTSLPLYLDPPNNWPQQQAPPQQQQQQQHQQQITNHQQQQLQQGIISSSSSNGNHPQQLPLPTTQPPAQAAGAGSGNGGQGSIRPGSMADRARMAKLPQPEIALKCPRCDSTNTKFCYFNNYSLSQPRHFCKTCRRYWTRGGALRNVPVGGGCRRNNKRSSKSSNSKSPVKTGSGSTSSIPSNSGTSSDMIGHMQQNHQPSSHQLPNFMASLQHHLTDHHHHHYGTAAEMGFNFGGIFHPAGAPTAHDIEFNMGSNNSSGGGGGGGISLSSRGAEQWRLQQLQQFPFLAGLEPPPGLYPFVDGTEAGGEPPPTSYVGGGGSSSTAGHDIMAPKQSSTTPNSSMAMLNGVPSVKMEENNHQGGMNLSRHFLGINPGSDHHYLGSGASNAWTDLSGFTSSSNSHLL